MLQDDGHTVSYMSRKYKTDPAIMYYKWDVDKGVMDGGGIEKADAVIHLAGAGVADKKWTAARKQEILDSRIKSTQLLVDKLKSGPHKVKAFVSASAIGIYPDAGEGWLDETAKPGSGFLAEVCQRWEAAADEVAALGIRTVKIRIGIVLDAQGGALPQMAGPIKMFVGAPLGNGKQYMSWIHIEDLARLFVHAVENPEMEGVYNGTAPTPVTNAELTRIIADALGRPVLPVKVPGFAMKLALGDRVEIVTSGARVSADKTLASGFDFRFNDAKTAVRDLLG